MIFVENVIDVNYELSTDILISPNVLFNPKGESEKCGNARVVRR